MIYGILVIYYEDKFERAIEEFNQLISKINSEYEILIISNNPKIGTSRFKCIEGNDKTSEFSGWQEGLKSIKSIKDDDLVIFGNDTFCTHRKWSDFEKNCFIKIFEKCKERSTPCFAGEIDSVKHSMKILGYVFSSWVSSYLFSMNGHLLKKIGYKIHLDPSISKRVFSDVSNRKINWSEDIDFALRKQLENWLDPKNPNGWYNKSPNDLIISIKLNAIINELYISAYIYNNGYKIYDSYRNIGLTNSIHRYIDIQSRKIKSVLLTIGSYGKI